MIIRSPWLSYSHIIAKLSFTMNQSIENRGPKIAFTDAAARRVKRIHARLLYAKRKLYSKNFLSCPLSNSIVICIIVSLSVVKKAIKNLQHYIHQRAIFCLESCTSPPTIQPANLQPAQNTAREQTTLNMTCKNIARSTFTFILSPIR